MDPTWRDQAACLDVEPEWFFPTTPEQAEVALSYCAGCPVVAACGQFGRRNATAGVWGGQVLGRPDRKGMSVCVECNHLTRKPGTSLEDFPATRTWKTKDLCSTCYHRRQREAAAA